MDKEEIDMCEALQGIFDDGVELGIKQGILLTKQIIKLWKEGIREEEIAERCGLTVREVKEILE